MKLCHIVPSLEERYGGPSKSVFALSTALAQGGSEIELLATAPGPDETRIDGPLAVRIFHRDWPAFLCPSSGLRHHLRATRVQIVHHHALWLRTLHYAHHAARQPDTHFVVSPRGMMAGWAWRHHRWRKYLAGALVHPGALQAVHGWHATSGAEAADIRSQGFTQPICIAPNGVDAPSAEEQASAAAHWSAACPEAAGRPVALFFSRFHRKKRLLELIDTWLEQGPRDWLLLVVGIPEEYSVAMLAARVRQASGADRVRIFSGVGRPPPYPIARLFLLPSHNENFRAGHRRGARLRRARPRDRHDAVGRLERERRLVRPLVRFRAHPVPRGRRKLRKA